MKSRVEPPPAANQPGRLGQSIPIGAATGLDRRPLRVVKLGGSLLDWELLADRFHRWQRELTPARLCVIVGGGGWSEAVRRAQPGQQWTDETAHWLAIDAMGVAAHVAAARLHLPIGTKLPLLNRSPPAECSGPFNGNCYICNPAAWLRRIEPLTAGCRLPLGWHVTSDSIAARVAECCAADELILLKSRDAVGDSPEHWSAAGLVDPWFPVASASIRRVTSINLRTQR